MWAESDISKDRPKLHDVYLEYNEKYAGVIQLCFSHRVHSFGDDANYTLEVHRLPGAYASTFRKVLKQLFKERLEQVTQHSCFTATFGKQFISFSPDYRIISDPTMETFLDALVEHDADAVFIQLEL